MIGWQNKQASRRLPQTTALIAATCALLCVGTVGFGQPTPRRRAAERAEERATQQNVRAHARATRPRATKAHGTVRVRARNRRRRPVRGPDPRIDENEVVTSSISIGRPDRGRLLGATELRASPTVVLRSNDHHFGTDEFVGALLRATTEVGRRFPHTPPLFIGDISRRTGGRISPHRSHRAGRDADVGFFATNLADEPVELDQFVGFRITGLSRERPDLKFDDRRTWAMVEVLLFDPIVRPQYIFIYHELRDRLLAFARAHSSPDAVARAEMVLFADNVHRNHMHVRIYCAEDDRPRCEDERPYHAWAFPGGRREYPRSEAETLAPQRVQRRARRSTPARARRASARVSPSRRHTAEADTHAPSPRTHATPADSTR